MTLIVDSAPPARKPDQAYNGVLSGLDQMGLVGPIPAAASRKRESSDRRKRAAMGSPDPATECHLPFALGATGAADGVTHGGRSLW